MKKVLVHPNGCTYRYEDARQEWAPGLFAKVPDRVDVVTDATRKAEYHLGFAHYQGNTRKPVSWRHLIKNRIKWNLDTKHHATPRGDLWHAVY